MKSTNLLRTITALLILNSLTAVFSRKLKTSSNVASERFARTLPDDTVKVTSTPPNSESNISILMESLFNDPSHPPVCSAEKKEKEDPTGLKIAADGSVSSLPRKKTNYYEKKKLGWDASAYLFDYLDDVLQKDIASEFERIFNAAQKIQPPAGFIDPYSLDKMLVIKSSPPSKEEMFKQLTALSPSFNPTVWESSISVGQVETILKEWEWYSTPGEADPAKFIVDKYDFDGDGRLNSREFIIAMIRNNKRAVDSAKKCKNCLENVIMNKIDPIYQFLDCAARDEITSQQIWSGLTRLKKAVTGYDIYKCSPDGGKYRTTAVNDFVLKSQKMVEGKLTREEWRLGVLTGYWERQTDASRVFTDDSKNMKKLRWGQDGSVDIVCERIKNSIQNIKG